MASRTSEKNHPSPKAEYLRYDKPRLLIDMIDERARISLINYSQGCRKITYAQIANAVNGAAKLLAEKLGPGKDSQTLCYMGWNDLRYLVLILGAVKAGYKVAPIVKLHDYLHVLTIPSIEELLNTTYEYFPYGKTFEEAKAEPLVALHTSGTTGLPKPVIFTHDYAVAYVRALQLEPPEGFESLDRKSEGGRVFSLTAPFHTSAICIAIAATANQTTYIFPPAATIPTAALAVE
ncbi:hypothetical protein BOTNAR_0374g00130 [Botryotinia narcissicola]|uniref:AMP-dependent synthetase/ligase domain-containing protein n=1 Tax=Botryotinia narcissicola TaxID=278944 RepID=A0A4Z1I1X6_9HELO|nr:hypothetical protein BOTNAR_0374g00130 [Botryotinia narcissicola]